MNNCKQDQLNSLDFKNQYDSIGLGDIMSQTEIELF